MKDILKYKNYTSAVHFDSENKILYGKIIGINDLVLFEGRSVNDLISAFQASVDDYLETCKELGKEPDKVYKGNFNVRVSSSIHSNIAKIAEKRGMKINTVAKKALDYLIANEDKVLL